MLYAIAKRSNRANMQMSAVVVYRATTDTTITNTTIDVLTKDLRHRSPMNINNKDMATIVIIKMLHPPNPRKTDTKIITMVQHHHLPQNPLKFHHHQNTTLSN